MKRWGAIILCLGLLWSGAVPAAAAAMPETEAVGAVLMEKETGAVICAKGEHEQLEPASVTKVMTLLLTMEAIDEGRLHYEDLLTASAHAASMGGSHVYLAEGEQMSVEDLLKAVCMASGNDAAVCLAEGLAGSEEQFAERMNARAAELSMNDTHFVNCTGLPAEGHVTSAMDLAILSRELILHHPDIRRFTTVWMDTLRDGTFQLANTNKLIRFYDGATGLKTGSTDAAKYCLSATAERNGMELIAVVLKAPTSVERFESAKRLLNYGFANYTLLEVYPDRALPVIPVSMGRQDTVQPVPAAENALLLEKTQVPDVEKSLELLEEISAPVAEGQQLGTLRLTAGGTILAELPIVAGEAVERVSYWDIVQKFLLDSIFAV